MATATLWTSCDRPNSVDQPIAYNHEVHLKEVGMECSDCHKYFDELARAGIPTIAECADCHEEPNGESAAEARVVEHVQNNEPIPWVLVNSLPQHVYFSHARHVKLGRLECAKCHGSMEDLNEPMREPFVPLSMDWCIDCHESRDVSNDCIRCHL